MKTDPHTLRTALSAGLIALAMASQAAAQAQPVVIPIRAAATGDPVLLEPEPAVTCDGEAVEPTSALPLAPGVRGETFARPEVGQRITRVHYRFAIDAVGRPFDIAPLPASDEGSDVLQPSANLVLQAGLAAWRFAAGADRTCRLTVRYTPVPVSRASPQLLASFFAVTRTNGAARRAVETRLGGDGADCASDRPALRRTGAPDFRADRGGIGGQEWTIVRWNFDEAGRAADVETLASSGDRPFDAAAREAVAASEAEPGAGHRGCVYNWYRRNHPLPAPPMPNAPPDSLAACPKAVLDTFRIAEAGGPGAPLPKAFLDRGIEGWALVRFDIAPWGEVGNVSVVEAQPADGFGSAARNLVAGGRAEPGEGAVRCLQPVVFQIPPEG